MNEQDKKKQEWNQQKYDQPTESGKCTIKLQKWNTSLEFVENFENIL